MIVKYSSGLASQNKTIEIILQESYSVTFPLQKWFSVEIPWLFYYHSLKKKENFYEGIISHYLQLSLGVHMYSYLFIETKTLTFISRHGRLVINEIFHLETRLLTFSLYHPLADLKIPVYSLIVKKRDYQQNHILTQTVISSLKIVYFKNCLCSPEI